MILFNYILANNNSIVYADKKLSIVSSSTIITASYLFWFSFTSSLFIVALYNTEITELIFLYSQLVQSCFDMWYHIWHVISLWVMLACEAEKYRDWYHKQFISILNNKLHGSLSKVTPPSSLKRFLSFSATLLYALLNGFFKDALRFRRYDIFDGFHTFKTNFLDDLVKLKKKKNSHRARSSYERGRSCMEMFLSTRNCRHSVLLLFTYAQIFGHNLQNVVSFFRPKQLAIIRIVNQRSPHTTNITR